MSFKRPLKELIIWLLPEKVTLKNPSIGCSFLHDLLSGRSVQVQGVALQSELPVQIG